MRALPLLALIATALACGPSATTDPVANCVEQQKLYCAFAYRCCVDVEERERFAGFAFVAHRNEGECVEAYTDLCEAFGSAQRISAERGRIAMDADKVTGCLATRQAAVDDCDLEAYSAPEEDCTAQVEALVEDGDACIASYECAEGGTCVIDYDDEGEPRDVDEELGVAEGECEEPPGVGEECPDFQCAEGLYCDGDVCQRYPAAGEECPNFVCADGLSCQDPDGDFDYTCEPLLANGEECDVNSECASGYCAPEGECETLEVDDDTDYDYCEG